MGGGCIIVVVAVGMRKNRTELYHCTGGCRNVKEWNGLCHCVLGCRNEEWDGLYHCIGGCRARKKNGTSLYYCICGCRNEKEWGSVLCSFSLNAKKKM